MRNRVMAAIALTTAVVVWIGVSAQQEMLPRPGPGSGVMDVRGTVSIANAPDVRVVQLPPAVASGPTFLEKGSRYAITWPDGKTDTVTIVSTGEGAGWARVGGRGERWINLNAALSVERVH